MQTLHIAITGSTGMIGRQLTDSFSQSGHRLTLLARRPTVDPVHKASLWDPDEGIIRASDLERQDAVIHLAGKNIAASHWSESHKRAILESRVRSTELLVRTLIALKHPPKILLSASAIGYYGNRSSEDTVDESSPPGTGFMAEVCVQWEAAAAVAHNAGIRVVSLRTGMVLTSSGGVLAKMLPIFKLGLGGKIGSGKQVMSWVALDELAPIIMHIVNYAELSGAVNLVSPNPVTNADFARLLAKSLTRPSFFSVPALGAKLALGEMAEELLLSGAHVIPGKLTSTGYQFIYPYLEDVFREMLVKR